MCKAYGLISRRDTRWRIRLCSQLPRPGNGLRFSRSAVLVARQLLESRIRHKPAREFLLREFSTDPKPSLPPSLGKTQKVTAPSGRTGSVRVRGGGRDWSAAASRWDRDDRRERSIRHGKSGKFFPAAPSPPAYGPQYSAQARSIVCAEHLKSFLVGCPSASYISCSNESVPRVSEPSL